MKFLITILLFISSQSLKAQDTVAIHVGTVTNFTGLILQYSKDGRQWQGLEPDLPPISDTGLYKFPINNAQQGYYRVQVFGTGRLNEYSAVVPFFKSLPVTVTNIIGLNKGDNDVFTWHSENESGIKAYFIKKPDGSYELTPAKGSGDYKAAIKK